MKRLLQTIPAFFLALACAAGCAAPNSVPLQQDFLERGHASIGVALRMVGTPGIRYRTWVTGPETNGGDYDRVPAYSHLGDYTPPVNQPWGSLESELDAVGSSSLRAAVNRFAQGITRPGWRVVPLVQTVDKVETDAPYLKGLDALVVLDYSWYGTLCHNAQPAGDLADGCADLTASMIDLSTGGILWQTRLIQIRNPAWCPCSDATCYSSITAGVRGAVYDAEAMAVKDFFGIPGSKGGR
jgi:hypothetical protein